MMETEKPKKQISPIYSGVVTTAVTEKIAPGLNAKRSMARKRIKKQ